MNRPAYLFGALCCLVAGGVTAWAAPHREANLWWVDFTVILLAIPSGFAVWRALGHRGLAILAVLGLLAVVLDLIAVATGWPFGPFQTDTTGITLFDHVPWTIPFAWAPLILATLTLATRVARRPIVRIILSGVLLVAIDMVVDPAAVSLGMWFWIHPGRYYDIPLSDFLGWVVVGTLSSWLAYVLLVKSAEKPLPVAFMGSGFLMLSYWTGVCLGKCMAVPVWLGVELLLYLSLIFFTSPRARVMGRRLDTVGGEDAAAVTPMEENLRGKETDAETAAV